MKSNHSRLKIVKGQSPLPGALLKKGFLILCGLLFASCASITTQKTLTSTPPSQELVQQLREYFQADPETSKKLLPELLKYPCATAVSFFLI